MDVSGIINDLKTFAAKVANRQIVTILGEPTISGEIKDLKIDFPANSITKGIITNINMLQADVTTSVHPDLAGGQFPQMNTLHDRMVELSTAVLERNAGILKELAAWLIDKPEPPAS